MFVYSEMIKGVRSKKKWSIWLYQLGQKNIFNLITIQIYINHDSNGCINVNYSLLKFGVFLSREMPMGTSLHPRIEDTNLVTKNVFIEGYYVILNKAAYMDNETWEKVVKVVAPGIRQMRVRNVAFVLTILFSTFITYHLFTSKLSPDDI